MTLLTACQQVARESKVGVPSSIISNSDQIAVGLLAAANRELVRLAKANNWAALFREHAITLAASTTNYAEATDLLRYVDNTAWDRTNYWKLRGSMTASEWQVVKSGLTTTAAVRRNYRIKWDTVTKARRVFIDPTPASADSLVIEYISNELIKQADDTMVSVWTADADVTVMPEEIFELGVLWRFKKNQGQAYFEEKTEYDDALSKEIGDDVPLSTITVGRADPDGGAEFFDNVPDTGIGQ